MHPVFKLFRKVHGCIPEVTADRSTSSGQVMLLVEKLMSYVIWRHPVSSDCRSWLQKLAAIDILLYKTGFTIALHLA